MCNSYGAKLSVIVPTLTDRLRFSSITLTALPFFKPVSVTIA
jgi:hypothetical protein